MNIKKISFGLVLATLISGVINSNTYASLPHGGRLVIYSQDEPKSLDPLFNESESAKAIYNLVYSGLVKVDDNFDSYADLAVTVPTFENKGVIQDGSDMIVTYKLKEMTFWHDGVPVTAEDIIFTWQCYTNPDIKKAPDQNIDGYQKIYKIESTDPKTVKIYFKEHYADYNKLFTYILPKHGFLPKTLLSIDSKHPFNYSPIGSGPFKFVDWKPGKRLTLDVNEKYYRPRPHIDQVIYTYGKFNKAVVNDIEKGEIQLFQNASVEQKNMLTNIKNINTLNVASMSMDELAFNTESKILNDLNIRKAIAHAINKEKIAEKFPELKSTWSDSHPNSSIYENKLKDVYLYDMKMSQYLLDNSGWIIDDKDGVRKNSNNMPLELNLITTDSKIHNSIAEYMKENLSYLGIKLNIKSMNDTDFAKETIDSTKYDIAIYNKNCSINGEDRKDYLGAKSLPPYGHNYSRFNAPQINDIFNSSNKVNNVDSEKQVSSLLREELPIIPLFSYVRSIAVSNRLNNFRPNMVNGNTWNISEWWLN
ncbi:MAG: peptide ABC transporter substrate-binding protein [Candidatus Sericytochromatia bacterium]|nr:peptide ABC transporter substrate-binding protein [Candidatus Sericytochromatia bacterium]